MRLKCQNFRHLHVKMDITAINVYINLLSINYFQTIKDWFKNLKHYKLLLNTTNYHIISSSRIRSRDKINVPCEKNRPIVKNDFIKSIAKCKQKSSK